MKTILRFTAFTSAVLSIGMIFAQVPAPAPTQVPAPAPAVSPAQAAASAPTAAPAASNDPKLAAFEQQVAVYKGLAAQIQTLQEAFETAAKANDTAKVQEIQKSAPPILEKAKQAYLATVPAAKEAFAVSDGKNPDLNDFMLSYANYLLSTDDYDEAYVLFAAFLSKGMHKTYPEIFEMAGVSAFGSNRFAQAKKCFDFATQSKQALSRQAQVYANSIQTYYTDEWAKEQKMRERDASADNLPQVMIHTTAGDMVIELFENEAPNTVKNFITLAEQGFYRNLPFHRVLPGFMAQGGCPKGDGTGDAGYKLPEEFSAPNARKHFRGSLAMARSMDPNSAGSQFYITFLPNQSLDGQYTVFGRVISGLDTLSKIERIDPERPYPGEIPTKIIDMKVLRKQNHSYSDFKKM